MSNCNNLYYYINSNNKMVKCEHLNQIKKLALVSIIAIQAIAFNTRNKKKRIWMKQWLRRRESNRLGLLSMVHNELSLEDEYSFKNYLRMDITTFHTLLKMVTTSIEKKNTHLRESISARDRLTITLRFLATGESYKSLSLATRVAACTISTIVPEVCQAICDALMEKYIKLPTTKEEWLKVAEGFYKSWQVPNCIGAMDGKHVVFQAPKSAGSFFYNYKDTHSIVLLAIVDACYNFLYINCGTNGRISDGGVFAACDFNLELKNDTLKFPSERPLPGLQEPIPFVILADAAFPLQKHILKPYPFRNMTHEERIFNYRLSRGRRVVENVFGILANRFRIFLTTIKLSPEKVELITLTCCVLHNFHNTEQTTYVTRTCVDQENEDGSIQPGDWRNGETFSHTATFKQHRPTMQAIHIRNAFKKCFNETFTVPWQNKYV